MRKILKNCLQSLKEEYEKKPYEYWKTAQLPMSFEMNFENKEIQIEIYVLEEMDNYINIVISADCGFISQIFPSHTNLIVEKPYGQSPVKNEIPKRQ